MDLKKILRTVVLVLVISATAIGGTFSYLVSFDMKNNTVAIGHNTTEIQENFPNPSPIPRGTDSQFQKSVWVSNSPSGENGFNAACFVRMSVGYSNYDIGKAVVLNNLDTENWIYNPSDGYYYYTKKLAEGESTSPLFTGIKIVSDHVDQTYLDKISEFEVYVYEESVQAGDFLDYENAWNHYLSCL